MNRSLPICLALYLLVNACYERKLIVPQNNGLPCGTVNSPALQFTLDDQNGNSLLTPERVPRFYIFEGYGKKYVDYQWSIQPFRSDSSQKYIYAKNVTYIENTTKTFFFNDSLGFIHYIEIVVANNPSDPTCPGAYNLTKVTFDGQIKQAFLKDYVPHFKFRLP